MVCIRVVYVTTLFVLMILTVPVTCDTPIITECLLSFLLYKQLFNRKTLLLIVTEQTTKSVQYTDGSITLFWSKQKGDG